MPAVREMPLDCQPMYRAQTMGMRYLANHELIQLVYSFKDTETGELLVSKAPTLRQLSQLSAEELTEVPGVGKNAAIAIQAALELGRRMGEETATEQPLLNSPAAIFNYASHMQWYEVEHMCVLLLNTKMRPMGLETIHVGTVDACQIAIGQLFKPAIKRSAAHVVLLHNHPSGDPTPSPEDVRTTQQVIEAGKLLDIAVVDHVVIGRNRCASLRELRLCAF